MMLPSCSSREIDTIVITKTKYVFPPEEYLAPTHVPSIDGFERDNDGLAKAYLATKRALISANEDKSASRRYIETKKAEQAATE